MSPTGRAGLYRCAPVLGTGTTHPTDTTGRPSRGGPWRSLANGSPGWWRAGRTRHEHRLGRRQRALSLLVGTPYGHEVRVDQSLEEAQHGVAATRLWHLRLLGGWVPRQGADLVRWSSPSAGPGRAAAVPR
jgi:hypothetical protein